MSDTRLPSSPDLDHLKHQAKALRDAFARGDAQAIARVRAVLGERTTLKLTEAQRVIAREYGFPSWARLRLHVIATRSVADAVDAFLQAVTNRDAARALAVRAAEPRIVESLAVAAALGFADEAQRIIARDPAQVHARTGRPYSAEPLLWLCFSPFHSHPDRVPGLERTARLLLDTGADPNAKDGRYGVSALYGVTGMNHAPRIARMLLEAGANPNDGESAFHAAEHFHEDALELLREFDVDLNATGEWGNTPLWFLLRWHDVANEPKVQSGFEWLLAHGADANVRSGREQETALHVAVRTLQHPDIVTRLLEHGADVHARRGDGRSVWMLAQRAGADALVELLERHGAQPEPLSPIDELIAACGRGDIEAARRLSTPERIAQIGATDLRLLPEAAAMGRFHIVHACIAAGFPVDTAGESGATALHFAAIRGAADTVRALLERGADFRIRDGEHDSTPLGWALYGAGLEDGAGDHAATVRTLLQVGARPDRGHTVAHDGVQAVLAEHGVHVDRS